MPKLRTILKDGEDGMVLFKNRVLSDKSGSYHFSRLVNGHVRVGFFAPFVEFVGLIWTKAAIGFVEFFNKQLGIDGHDSQNHFTIVQHNTVFRFINNTGLCRFSGHRFPTFSLLNKLNRWFFSVTHLVKNI